MILDKSCQCLVVGTDEDGIKTWMISDADSAVYWWNTSFVALSDVTLSPNKYT